MKTCTKALFVILCLFLYIVSASSQTLSTFPTGATTQNGRVEVQSGTSTLGGNASLLAGSKTSEYQNGGHVYVKAGNVSQYASPGNVYIEAGSASSYMAGTGNIHLHPGTNTSNLGTVYLNRANTSFFNGNNLTVAGQITTASLKLSNNLFTVTSEGRVGIGTSNLEDATFAIYKESIPSMELRSPSGRLEFGVATGFNHFAPGSKAGDAVIRTLGGGSLIMNIPNTFDDGNSFIAMGDNKNGTWFKAKNNAQLEINGKVGIGTTNFSAEPDARLLVKGKIVADEIVVKNVAADFVFEDDYSLRSLDEVESFIKVNRHLPGIAPASETSKGVELSKFNTQLLQKIEELTLYLIEQEKRIQRLEAENQALRE